MEYIASISYGKDSLAMLEVIHRYSLPLDRIVHVEIMATDTIHADLPPMVAFKEKADKIIYEKYGIRVEHISSPKSYEDYFYSVSNGEKSLYAGKIYGFPMQKGNWCTGRLKQSVLQKVQRNAIVYIGIAIDEPKRFHMSICASIISGMVLFFLQRFFKKKQKVDEERDRAKAKENMLILKSIDAVGKLTYADAVAIRDGKTNGEMKEAMKAYAEVKDELYEYLLEQNSKK